MSFYQAPYMVNKRKCSRGMLPHRTMNFIRNIWFSICKLTKIFLNKYFFKYMHHHNIFMMNFFFIILCTWICNFTPTNIVHIRKYKINKIFNPFKIIFIIKPSRSPDILKNNYSLFIKSIKNIDNKIY
jgi:hypothetical protein